jgi:hypothetical protein
MLEYRWKYIEIYIEVLLKCGVAKNCKIQTPSLLEIFIGLLTLQRKSIMWEIEYKNSTYIIRLFYPSSEMKYLWVQYTYNLISTL